MAHDLEAPGTDEAPNWDSLYRARGGDVVVYRPIFTGDVFANIHVVGEQKAKSVIVLQHPCAIRIDGVTLAPKLLVAEVQNYQLVQPSLWAGKFYRVFPLAALTETSNSCYAAVFSEHHLVTPRQLDVESRIACLSQKGVNLLLQRWVHHNSRVVVPTHIYQDSSGPQYEEAEIIENWCTERADDGIDRLTATSEIDSWLSDRSVTGVSPRDSLQDAQHRSAIRQAVRRHLRDRRKQELQGA